MPIHRALTRHGPLAAGNPPVVAGEFVVAPQLPTRGDVWDRYADAVAAVVRQVRAGCGADPARAYLTRFSFGGNGVFDLALAQPGAWAALWPVDPTRVPATDPGRPVWVSSGEVSRHAATAFARTLRLGLPRDDGPGDRVYEDRGEDHVGTARSAYRDDRVYRWLLSHRLPAPTEPSPGTV